MKRWIDSATNQFMGVMIVSTIAIWGLMAVWVALTTDRQPLWLNTAFCVTWLISIAMTVPIVIYARRRPADAEPTWGEAMLAATYVFFLLFWIYGVVPHQFLTFADSELAWRSDKLFIGPDWLPWTDQGLLEWALPFSLNYIVVRDILVVIIYNIFFGLQLWLWVMWQLRGKEAPTTDIETSRYGRPVLRTRDLATEGANA